ncbi:Acetamidase regulatory [Hyphodiscus hymeniophilus]|uniref:Acetamidase regulatory n=1 Tax=Hyphodiscus hymeniophilus TaxID=353542 RepID=A0A9P7AYE8_9HELO|nr:Acetamidase regulatory [Hyphodiscus hymeniophilus]
MSTENTANNKNRIPAACGNCHERKVRCDAHKRGFPCSNCISSQRLNCRKHEKRRKFHPRPLGSFVPIRAIGAESIHESTTPATSNESRGASQEFLDQKETTDRSVLRGTRVTYVGKDVSNLNFLVRQREGEVNAQAFHFSSDDIASQFNTHLQLDHIPREAFRLPEKSLADNLIEAYFTHINPWTPIVDEDTFMSQYQKQDPTDPPSLLLFQAILLVGAHVSQERPIRDTLKATFFRRAKMLFDGRLEKNRDFVVQAALLLTWHSDGVDDVAANSYNVTPQEVLSLLSNILVLANTDTPAMQWFWVGIASRTAIGIGMCSDPGPLNGRPHHPDMHTFRRIWWVLFQFDVTVALLYGRPQAINLDDCDVKPLCASDFKGCGPNVQIDHVIKRTELCILISRIVKERFGLRVSKDERKVALGNADIALADWCLNLPDSLQMRSTEMNIWTSSLHLTYSNFLILLHRPHPRAKERSENYGPNDSDICGTAANTITNIFESLRSRDMIKYLWISDINALFTAMVQVSVELRFSNPVLAINALRRFDSSLAFLSKLAEYWTNAEAYIRIFQESSHLQHGIRHEQGLWQNTRPTSSNNDIHDLQIGQSFQSGNLDPEVLATSAGAVIGSAQALKDNLDDGDSWKDLFPPSDTATDSLLFPNDLPVQSEWRDIYWQEPGISESFGDGFWGWQ